jgi:2',3'-cyclic-nucleotide 2'-phosphodiesterase (5'-nucleotidase family)
MRETDRSVPDESRHRRKAPITRLLVRRIPIAVVVAATFAFVACDTERMPSRPVEPAHLRVLATHDFHGALLPRAYPWSRQREIGGVAALKAYMDRAEAACDCTTLRLDGGDLMQGTLPSNLVLGASTVAAFNLLDVDAAAIGNHELDWEVDVLRQRLEEAQFAWLAANVYRRDDGKRPDWARPWTLLERDGLTIGVIGYLTADTPTIVRPATTAPYEFRRGYVGIRDAIDAVRQASPDFVTIVAHAAGDCNADMCAGEVVELARELPSGTVDLIVGGHAHGRGRGVVNGVPIVRAGASAIGLAIVDLFRAADGSRSFDIRIETLYADAVEPDPEMTAMLGPWLADAEAIAAEPVATLGEPLSNNRRGDRKLGTLIADAVRLTADADVGLMNPGGVRASLLAGPVSYGNLYDVMPFDNAVVKLRLNGTKLRELIEQTEALPYFSNLSITWNAGAADGERLTELTFADGRAVRDEVDYTLALSEFLAEGGDGFDLLIPMPRETTGTTLLDAMIAHLRALRMPVRLPDARRIRVVGLDERN